MGSLNINKVYKGLKVIKLPRIPTTKKKKKTQISEKKM